MTWTVTNLIIQIISDILGEGHVAAATKGVDEAVAPASKPLVPFQNCKTLH
jgi:hypothetical protein